MKVLLTKDVYKLGRAGDIKKVADGYGRNYLLPQGLAVLATPGALKQIEHIRVQASAQRAVLNQEMGGIAERIQDLVLAFPVKAGETGKLYGSITPQMIVDAIKQRVGAEIERRQVDAQPIRVLGEHSVRIRLTMDLVPEIKVQAYREGEAPALSMKPQKETPAVETQAESAEMEDESEQIGESEESA
ncbi:MAG TPA: 50S ribosomal protein L9 [Anaerolineales bacterium]|nr:50S ribosomal protein L9 [Anaerolineales bacterium]